MLKIKAKRSLDVDLSKHPFLDVFLKALSAESVTGKERDDSWFFRARWGNNWDDLHKIGGLAEIETTFRYNPQSQFPLWVEVDDQFDYRVNPKNLEEAADAGVRARSAAARRAIGRAQILREAANAVDQIAGRMTSAKVQTTQEGQDQ